jgi:hypothetical protein
MMKLFRFHLTALSAITLRMTGIGAKRVGACCAAVSVAGLLVSACGGSSHSSSAVANVNSSRVATAIQVSVRRERHVNASVTCPTGVPLREHVTFYCVAAVGSKVTPFDVTETGGAGHVTYVGVSPAKTRLLSTTQVARAIGDSIKSKKGITAVVRCPADIPIQQGLPFACTATTKSGAVAFEVRETDDHGHVTYRAL